LVAYTTYTQVGFGLSVTAFACEAGMLGLILSWVIPNTLNIVSAASLAYR